MQNFIFISLSFQSNKYFSTLAERGDAGIPGIDGMPGRSGMPGAKGNLNYFFQAQLDYESEFISNR